MLDLITSSVISLFSGLFGRSSVTLQPLELLAWQESAIFNLPSTQPDPAIQTILPKYLQNLLSQGIAPEQQGIWVQSDWMELANHRGTIPGSAASLTKIATSLVALSQWGAAYQFETQVYGTGVIKEGVLQGDLVIVGSKDPFFVWEEGIALGNALNQLGIRQVTGNLVVNDQFYMNYQAKSLMAAELLKQALNVQLWSAEATQQYLTLPLGTPQPKVAIAGSTKLDNTIPPDAHLLIRHQSLPLAEIIKQMNIYSNNEIAQMLADAVGGAKYVSKQAAKIASVSPTEIQLINGSGLGVENRLSPRAVCRMLMAIDRLLESDRLQFVDLFPLSGRDAVGTIKGRSIPVGIAFKTGTLDQVSALAGGIPTGEQGQIWFAIINSGNQIEYLRKQQDHFLNQLANHWQLTPTKLITNQANSSFLGDPQRNLVTQSYTDSYK
jgi:D-alanyl-D-alanine carboxypeptidase/D-alanyl-D-alanine-endopeptidase (penicillin-binding protein 4)